MADDKPPLAAGTPIVPSGSGQSPGTNAIVPGSPALNPVPPGAVSAEPMAVAPIPLNPPPASKRAPTISNLPGKKDMEPKDTFRELIETVVFVVVLVLMLKTFLAEAFVIPTGSMATTLLGYHYKVTCQQCGYPNLVNA